MKIITVEVTWEHVDDDTAESVENTTIRRTQSSDAGVSAELTTQLLAQQASKVLLALHPQPPRLMEMEENHAL